MLLAAVAALPALIWIYLLAARGGFWRISRLLTPRLPATAARVAVVIPARNEADVLGRALDSLLAQDFPAPLRIYVVDDGSKDSTADIARSKEDRVQVITGTPLPEGWTGKLWAMNQGVNKAREWQPDYVLFTDADIVHSRHSLSELVSLAEARGYDLTSHMVRLACQTTAEKALIPAFVFFFLKLYPPSWIASDQSKIAGAAGGCILIRTQILDAIAGLSSIRAEVIDDCALARAVKQSGGQIWLGLTPHTHSIRSYGTFSEIGRMIARTAFNQLHHSIWLLIGTILGLFLTYLLPPLLLLFAPGLALKSLGIVAWALMIMAYVPTLKFYGQSSLWSLALPLVATFYLGATLYSALKYWRGKGGAWKGRVQDVR